jgi:hypothetical protein
MDSPTLVDVVVQCIDERAIHLLFSKGCCMQLFFVDIRGAAEIDYGDSEFQVQVCRFGVLLYGLGLGVQNIYRIEQIRVIKARLLSSKNRHSDCNKHALTRNGGPGLSVRASSQVIRVTINSDSLNSANLRLPPGIRAEKPGQSWTRMHVGPVMVVK